LFEDTNPRHYANADALAELNGRAYTIVETARGTELWSTDGTPKGTSRVRRLPAAWTFEAYSLTEASGRLLFFSHGPGTVKTIWASDGTAQGTQRIRTFGGVHLHSFYAVGNRVHFVLDPRDDPAPERVWETDGTRAGTRPLPSTATRPRPGDRDKRSVRLPEGRVLVGEDDLGSGLFVEQNKGAAQRLLTRFDNRTRGSDPTATAVVDGTLLFGTMSGEYQALHIGQSAIRKRGPGDARSEVLRTFDTQIVMRIDAAPATAARGVEAVFTVSTPFWVIFGYAFEQELWATDGTAGGTRRLANSTLDGGWLGDRYFFLHATNRQLFSEDTRLAVTDGTPLGTQVVSGVPAEFVAAPFRSLHVAGGRVILTAATEDAYDAPQRIWVSDPEVRRFEELPARARHVTEFTEFDGRVYFAGVDEEHGVEPWSTDGTAAGTWLVEDVNAGPGDSLPREFTEVGDALFFTATDVAHGMELWKTGGSAATTALVKDIAPGEADSTPTALTALREALYFRADDGVHGREVWRSGGSAASTTLLKDIKPGPDGSSPGEYALMGAVAGRVYFVADDGEHGVEYWASDGTPGGTHLIADVNPGPADGGYEATRPTFFNDSVLFPADDGIHGIEFHRAENGI
jgi:ELWxxDGT repeat protein